MMQRGEVDTLMTYFTITTRRMKYFTFPAVIAVERITALLKRHVPVRIRIDNLCANIHPSVYFVFVIAIAIVTIVYSLHQRFNVDQRSMCANVWRIVNQFLPGSNNKCLPRDDFITTNLQKSGISSRNRVTTSVLR